MYWAQVIEYRTLREPTFGAILGFHSPNYRNLFISHYSALSTAVLRHCSYQWCKSAYVTMCGNPKHDSNVCDQIELVKDLDPWMMPRRCVCVFRYLSNTRDNSFLAGFWRTFESYSQLYPITSFDSAAEMAVRHVSMGLNKTTESVYS